MRLGKGNAVKTAHYGRSACQSVVSTRSRKLPIEWRRSKAQAMIAALQDFAAVNRYSKPEVGLLSGLNPVQ